jgi:hypothetical protein
LHLRFAMARGAEFIQHDLALRMGGSPTGPGSGIGRDS